MISLKIDDKNITVQEGLTILEAAKENNIEIPTFCYHEAIKPFGACRLCIVEIEERNYSKIVASCLYSVTENLVVRTDSEKIRKLRKIMAELLLSRCPGVVKVKDMAECLGVKKPRFKLKDSDCILCGLCVRACEEIVGTSAISLVNRGPESEVKPPFEIASNVCIGCATCVYICPTGAIKMEDIGNVITMHDWDIKSEMRKCKICGNYQFTPEFLSDYRKIGLKNREES